MLWYHSQNHDIIVKLWYHSVPRSISQVYIMTVISHMWYHSVISHIRLWYHTQDCDITWPKVPDAPVTVFWLELLNFLNFLNLWGGRPAPGARHRSAHFAIGLRGVQVFKIAPMANYRELSFKSSEIMIGTLIPGYFQRSSVLPTRAFSEWISNVNLSFCT